ncbi:WXG100 family type VII secretion target [Amycolatopsis sp. A133]|uniref:WXG100 family type VII secretion target n=1 Tax=Amycolatopsis sp. A133 TaxID=3064472 RepID=UPI0027F1B39D|nr:WXG100 family type VII secretion target [Amycolatopsis sp. A133]MDQ7806266.1 WXG100 family type VII secretion target [Amycolatopsis sp. A133]
MAGFNVQPDQLRALSRAYEAQADTLRAQFYNLASQTEPMLNEWAGAASSSFRGLAQNINTRQRELIESLDKMASILANAADAFESVDRNISSALRGERLD